MGLNLRHPLELDRFRAACRLSAQYWKCKWSRDIRRDADRFAQLATDYTEKRHATADADTNWTFKDHVVHHLASQFVRDECVVDCLPGERAHLLAREVAENIKNTQSFELNMLPRMLISHLEATTEAGSFDDRLLGNSFEMSNIDARGAKACVLWGVQFKQSDVVFLEDCESPVLIQACIDLHETGLGLLVTPLIFHSIVNRVANLYEESGRTEIVKKNTCSRVTPCRAWCREPHRRYVVVRAGSVY